MTSSMVLVAITLNNMFINATFLHMYLYFPLLEWDLQASHFQHHLHQQHNVHIDFQLGNDILQRRKKQSGIESDGYGFERVLAFVTIHL